MRCHNPHKDRSSPSLLGPTEISISLSKPQYILLPLSYFRVRGSSGELDAIALKGLPPPLVPLPFSAAFPPALLAVVNYEPLSYRAAFSAKLTLRALPLLPLLYPSLYMYYPRTRSLVRARTPTTIPSLPTF